MLESYISIKPAINYTISRYPDEFTNIKLNDDDIKLIEQLIIILKPFLYASKELQTQKEPIFILSHLIITQLHNHITKLIRLTSSPEIKSGLENGLEKLEKYFLKQYIVNTYDIYAFSIILDPRFKIEFLQKKLNYLGQNIIFIKQRFRSLYDRYFYRYKNFNPNQQDDNINKELKEDDYKTYKE